MSSIKERDRQTRAEIDAREERYAARGWRPSEARRCPRYVAHKHCVRNGHGRCICERHHLDHGAIWHTEEGERIYTFEPYSFSLADAAALHADLAEIGLIGDIEGRSPWYPGSTFLVEITKA